MRFKELKQLIKDGEYRVTELKCKNDIYVEDVANVNLDISDKDKTFDDYVVKYVEGGADNEDDCVVDAYVKVYVVKEPITRIEWLMQDKDKLLRFIEMVSKGEQDCGYCPFVNEDGILYGCCYSDPEDELYIQDCRMIDNDIEDFLKEEMPTEEQMKEWKKRSEELSK